MFETPPNATDRVDDFIIRPSIFLDYGVDAAADDTACEVCQRGMRFQSRWHFEPGTMLSVAFTFGQDPCRRMEVEGLVFECSRTAVNDYVTTLAFVEPPEELRAVLGEFSARMASQNSQNGCREGI